MTKPIRILLISHTCQSRDEGHRRAECLARMPGVELRVLVPDLWKNYGQWRRPEMPLLDTFAYEIGPTALRWIGPAQNYLHFYPFLARTLRQFQPDIIDLWEEPWAAVSAQTCFLRDRVVPRAKIVSETEQNINRQLPPPFEAMRRYVLQRADFAVGRTAEALEVDRSKGYAGPGAVVPNAVNTERFRPLDRAACRRALDLPDEAKSGFLLGYVGRLVEEKGLADMVNALRFCGPGIHCVFLGGGPYKEALVQLARSLGKTKQVHFLPKRPQEELPGLMNALDALALVSQTTATWKEQFGRVIIEAHACGTPVVGSRSGAIPEVVGAGGVIVPERDPEALAQAVMHLHAHPEDARRMGEQGRAEVDARYTWEQTAARMSEIYRRLCG